MTMGRLTRQEILFCYYYARLQEPGAAVERAEIPCENPEREGIRLLGLRRIRRRVEEEESAARREIEAKVRAGLSRLAFSPAGDSARLALFYGEMSPKEVSELDLFPISELKKTKDGGMELKLFDRTKAMELLLRLAENEGDGVRLEELYRALGSGASEKKDGEEHA